MQILNVKKLTQHSLVLSISSSSVVLRYTFDSSCEKERNQRCRRPEQPNYSGLLISNKPKKNVLALIFIVNVINEA